MKIKYRQQTSSTNGLLYLSEVKTSRSDINYCESPQTNNILKKKKNDFTMATKWWAVWKPCTIPMN